MNIANNTVFIFNNNILRKITLDFDYYQEEMSAETEDFLLKEGSDIQTETLRLHNKESNDEILRIIVPKQLKNSIILGISDEGSTRLARRLAWSNMLNVKHSYSTPDILSAIDLSDINYIIISGGYNHSPNIRLNNMITELGKNPMLALCKPKIIFAGSILSLEIAKKEVAASQLSLVVLDNLLENSDFAEGTNFADDEFLQAPDITTEKNISNEVRIHDFSYAESLKEISDMFCMKRGENVLSLFFTENYTLLSHAERKTRTNILKNYAIPGAASALTSNVLNTAFNNLFFEKQTVFDENFLQKDILSIDSPTTDVSFEPDRIIGVSLTPEIDFDKFIQIVSIPKVTRGTIYFLFDNSGIIPAAATIFLSKEINDNSFLRGFFNAKDIKNGWIFIPYGKFKYGNPAIYIAKLENDRKEDIVVKWGDYKIIEINSNSVVEIHTAHGVSLTKDNENTKKTIGTKGNRKTLIFDLREEMHK